MSETTRADLKAAIDRMYHRFGTKSEIKHLEERLSDDEEVRELVSGFVGPNIGVLVLTSRRVFFFFHDRAEQQFQECPLGSITSVDLDEKIFVYAEIQIDGEQPLRVKNIEKSDARRLADAIRRESGLGS